MDLTHSRLLSHCVSPDFLLLPVSLSAVILLCMSACSLGTGQRASGDPLGLSPYQPLLGPQSPNTSQTSFDLESDVRFERRPQ